MFLCFHKNVCWHKDGQNIHGEFKCNFDGLLIVSLIRPGTISKSQQLLIASDIQFCCFSISAH